MITLSKTHALFLVSLFDTLRYKHIFAGQTARDVEFADNLLKSLVQEALDLEIRLEVTEPQLSESVAGLTVEPEVSTEPEAEPEAELESATTSEPEVEPELEPVLAVKEELQPVSEPEPEKRGAWLKRLFKR